MSAEHQTAPVDAPPANGMVRFRVSVPARPDLAEKIIDAPDEHTAWAKYKDQIGQWSLPFEPKVEKA